MKWSLVQAVPGTTEAARTRPDTPTDPLYHPPDTATQQHIQQQYVREYVYAEVAAKSSRFVVFTTRSVMVLSTLPACRVS